MSLQCTVPVTKATHDLCVVHYVFDGFIPSCAILFLTLLSSCVSPPPSLPLPPLPRPPRTLSPVVSVHYHRRRLLACRATSSRTSTCLRASVAAGTRPPGATPTASTTGPWSACTACHMDCDVMGALRFHRLASMQASLCCCSSPTFKTAFCYQNILPNRTLRIAPSCRQAWVAIAPPQSALLKGSCLVA